MRLSSSINSTLEEQLKNMYFVGRLATKEEVQNTKLAQIGRMDDGENIQFQIKCLSEIPTELSDCFAYSNQLFAGNTYTQVNQRIFNFNAGRRSSIIEKQIAVENTLKDKLVLFRMRPTRNQQYINIDIIEVADINGEFEKDYIIIPSPLLKDQETRTDFENWIAKETGQFTLPSYPNLLTSPDLIYLEGRVYFNLTINKTQNPTTYFQKYMDEVKYIEVDEVPFNSSVVMQSDYNLIKVISLKSKVDLLDVFEEKGSFLYDTIQDVAKNNEFVTSESGIVQTENHVLIKNDEAIFLENLKMNALKRGLYYSDEDLCNFHICMKTNLLTIIGGMSGIGKSQLALLYAETLGMEYGKEVLLLPISPAYTEPNDLLGFLNPNTGIYNESETGLASLLMLANKASKKEDSSMYMVIFDEMNLAQVEHWFSPFISLLELDEEKRYLHLFNENSHCVNNYKSKIHIGSNVLFVGTVNFDETTKLFSDRLLDRANIFIPGKPTLNEMYMNCYNEAVNDLEHEPVIVHSEKYKNWTNIEALPSEKYKLTHEEIKVLDELHTLIHQQDQQKGISFRTAKNIAYYLNNIPVDEKGQPLISRERAFDIQLKQRVITKIRGIDAFVFPLLGKYKGDDFEPGSLTNYLLSFRYENKPDCLQFEKSIEVIKSKVKEIMHYGFTY